MWIIFTRITLPDFILFSWARTPSRISGLIYLRILDLLFRVASQEFTNLNHTVNVWENLISLFIFQVKLKGIHLNSFWCKWNSDCNVQPSHWEYLMSVHLLKYFLFLWTFTFFSYILLFSSRTCIKLYVSYCYWEYTYIRIITDLIVIDIYVIWLYHIINIFHISLIFIPILCAFASPLFYS